MSFKILVQLERLFGEEVYGELEDYLKYLCSFRASTDQLAVCEWYILLLLHNIIWRLT